MERIASFQGRYHFLSNFYPCDIEYDGVHYPSVEHAFQAAKTDDAADKLRIRDAPTPGRAKQLGQRVQLRKDWEDVKISIMKEILQVKFADPILAHKLRSTGNVELIEGNNWHDSFWGVYNGAGKNWLGKLLMEIREEVTE